MPELVLVSHALCPFVQRAAILLGEKGAPFERRDIDLAAKPDWFLAISPLGKVPLLQVGGEVLFESNVICEYLDETVAPALHPADALQRAKHRGWMEFASALFIDVYGLQIASDDAAFAEKQSAAAKKLATVEAALDARGPYFAGATFSLVDAAFAPAFRTLDLFDGLAGRTLFDGLPRVRAWRAALAARPSVQAAVPAGFPERMQAFLEAKGNVLTR